MAKKKRKHGKVEARQVRPRVKFRFRVLFGIILGTFLICFALYMFNAVRQEDYWDTVIVAEMEREAQESNAAKNPRGKNVTNPVPSSARADDSRMQETAFIGDVAEFVKQYETTAGMVFTDAVTDMPESRMRSIARSLLSANPKAVYIWYQPPADLEAGGDGLQSLIDHLCEQMPELPVYLLTAVPAQDAESNQRVDTWNATLFAMADANGLHYIDVSTTLKSNSGTLAEAYQDKATLYATVGDQILTHVAD